MNWVDGLVIIVLLIYIIEGLSRGFIEQTLELLGFFVTVVLAAWTYRPLATWLAAHFHLIIAAAAPLGFLIVWLILEGLYSAILHLTYPLLPRFIRQNSINHLAGIVPALAKAYIILSIALTLAVIAPISPVLKANINDSPLGSRIVANSGQVENYLDKLTGQNVEQSLTFVTVTPQNEQIINSNQNIDLGFKTTKASVDSQAETTMVSLVNQARQQNGLAALTVSRDLTLVAEYHSLDMFLNGYFAHNSLNGDSPFDRMTAAGISFQDAGENIAYAANVQLAFNGLMNSPEHKANILDKDYHQIGIGVMNGGIYGEMFTQDFTN